MPTLPRTALTLTLLAALQPAFAADPTPTKLPPVPQKIVDAAIAAPLIKYNKDFKGGAYTDGAWGGGASIVLAVAAYAGNESADPRLLEQIRLGLKGDSCICANGGYPTQHERHTTGMLALAKLTPRVWAKLTDEEKSRIDLVMKAALVGAAYTTADATNSDGKKPTALDGDNNLNRGWNPNYREGMVGEMIVGPIYFGPENAAKILDTYDHDAFVTQLKNAGLTNLYKTFNWKAAHPDSPAPTGAQITAAIKNYRYLKQDLSDPMEIYYGLTIHTYGAKVNAGLNDGKGFNGAGMIASGADELPNKGKDGMLLEFDSMDAGGHRSSITYAYDGFRPNLTNHIVLIAGGYWKNGPKADECLARMNVGITDLFYKLDHGYIDYSKGHASTKPFDIHQKFWNFEFTQSLYNDVVKPWHAKQNP